MKAYARLYIDGEWIRTGREISPLINPYSQEVIGEQVLATPTDVERALQSAFEAKNIIKAIPAYKRAQVLKAVARNLEAEKEPFAKLITAELGKPLKNTLDEVSRSIETLELSAEEAKRLTGETSYGEASPRGMGAIAATFRVPVGVVAAITPFNAPLNLICHKIGPAYAAGNSVILKPAPQTPLIATRLLELLLESGFHPKSINLLLGGAAVGRQMVKDARVNVVSFTGGVTAGRNICETAGMKKVLLELGGNAPTIVHEDADIQYAAAECAKSGYSNSGQSCISVQRMYVHHAVIHAFVDHLKQAVSRLQVGDPCSLESDIGCMVD